MSEHDKIIDMTRGLARAIQMDERYVKFQQAREASDNDAALQEAVGRYNMARINLNAETSKTEQNGEKVAQYNEDMRNAYEEAMASENMRNYDAAQQDVNKLVSYINAIISAAINGDDPDAVTEPGGCSDSGCSGCSGCG